ncbi:MAG TPA: lipid-A-disaccharide synthase [Ignavibacteria bacterium]|nr:lipid-A-disaccharide synthase [Ignavibacteria bacterium]HMQ99003.1 lipid-A-disaccharide synthase [Ignavibacteria bacterium]
MKEENSSRDKRSVFISAGESSGDMHASSLMKELRIQSPGSDILFSGLGGDRMITEGFNAIYHTKDLATVGFAGVIRKYSFFKRALKESAEFIRQNLPDTVILVDYPGFNLRLAEEIRKFYSGKIIYYISPQLWAWHEKRVFKVKKYIDLMLVVFPFEVDFYAKYGVKAEFTGHPLISRIREFIKHNPKIERRSSKKVVTVLPGSRKDEVKHHLPVLLDAIKAIRSKIDIEVNISIAPGMKKHFDDFTEQLTGYNLTEDKTYDLILNSDAVMTKAGTSTMECTLLGTPYLIFYRTFPLNYYLLKPIVKVDKLGIANLLLGKEAVREFVQNDFTASNIASEMLKLLEDDSYSQRMKTELKKVWDILGSKEASVNAAEMIKLTAGI